MIKGVKIPTILGIVILIAGIFAGVFLLNSSQIFKIGADPAASPKDIRLSNISDNSVTISWTTDKEASDFLEWGEEANKLDQITKEAEDDQKFTNHTITLTGLSPGKTYYYKINSNGSSFDNQTIPWEVQTGANAENQATSNVISGTVMNESGEPAERAILYLNIDGYLMSTTTSSTGNFIFQLGGARTQDLSQFAQINDAETILDISVVGAGGEVATLKILPQSARPIPPIILGQTYDHRNLPPSTVGETPNADLNIPEDATPESKLNIPSSTAVAPKTVSLESVESGEVVSSQKPEFFGSGPRGETITITIHSDLVTKTLTIPSSGTWNFTPPTNLSPGEHTITISWTDASGVLRRLTRSFVVQASEVPSFTASQSAQIVTPSPTPSPMASASLTTAPTAQPTPTTSPSPTPTRSPTPIPTAQLSPTDPPTPAALPESGDLTPTLLATIMGVGILAFGFFVWKLSEN